MFKLTANKEDVIKFSIFGIAMFLLISVLVNNLAVFSATGEFAGLNPFVHRSAKIGFGYSFL